MPGKSSSRCAAMTSSSGTYRCGEASRKRDSSGGTLTRAKCSWPLTGLRTTTARFSERPEMYGKGCAGSTASGVSTGKICCRKRVNRRACSFSVSSGPADQVDALVGELRARCPAGSRRRAGP